MVFLSCDLGLFAPIMNTRSFWNQLFNSYSHSDAIALMLVADSNGSSPGRKGFKMAVDIQGKMIGSIGGGIMEHKLVEYCKSLIASSPFQSFIRLQIHRSGESSDRSGMICSGEQTIVFYYLDRNWISANVDKLNTSKMIVYDQKSIRFESEISIQDEMLVDIKNTIWCIQEKVELNNQLYIIGAGHVGLALSEVMHRLDFELHLVDDRKDLNTLQYNGFIEEKNKLIVDYDNIDTLIPEGKSIYVVLVSFSYRTDELIIKKLLSKNLKYFGVMGSKTKMKVLRENLTIQGFDKNQIIKIYTPVGIDISSRTPQEIAISIAAQIIQIKNR